MEKRKAKVIKEESDKWILKVDKIDRTQWLFKDKANRSPIGDKIRIGTELDIEIMQEGQKWKIGRIWLHKSESQNTSNPNVEMSKEKSNFQFPNHSLSNENFYLKLFKQKRLFDDKYEFHNKFHTTFQKSEFDEKLIAKINQNNIENAKNLLGETRVKKDLVFTPEWRLILGLGGSSIYETGMTLHHIYGIPYLPASSVKGIVRSYVITEVYKNEAEALKEKGFCDVFGCNGEGKVDINGEKKSFKSYYKLHPSDRNDTGDRQGKVIFFDAFPQKTINLEADIMNPHYSPYYSDTKGEVPPADWHNPVPIPFLTAGNKTSFQFAIGVKRDKDLPLLEKANSWLESALQNKGIGAKTAVGYGYMNPQS